ncbi:clathrin [Babesia gibsoni]|uniref:Clathrin heavy chain n=1 Tax=Babesia gibsoni TaxID=33632 RepID=A0AAD8P893_BABGI|nr:clathrin [Babesia gibsoni]
MASNPLKVATVLRLKDLGFGEACFKFGTLTLGGDRFVCMKESEGAAPSVVIIDLHKGNEVSRKPIKAEAAIMNPTTPIIALKAPMENGHFVQAFHMETKEKLGNHQFNESVVFWRWVSNTKLALVTDTSVYHWTVGKGDPVLVFSRSGRLAEAATKLVLYAVDENSTWCMLCGIYSLDQGATVDGAIQLYSTERRQQQLLEGYAGTFGKVRISKEKVDKTGLIAFCEHKRGSQTSKLHCMDVYTQRTEGGPAPLKISKEIEQVPSLPGDFPIFVHILDSCGLVCLVTKGGYLHFHDAATATFLFKEKICDSPIFVADAKMCDGKAVGIVAVNRNGEVIEAVVDEGRLLSSISCPDDIAVSLATRFGFPGSEGLIMRSFEEYFSQKDYKQAALLVVTLKSGALRTPETMKRFLNAPVTPGQTSPALHYFSVLLEHGKLNSQESLELVRPVIVQGRKELIKQWLDEGKLTESEDLADLIRPMDALLAFKMYVPLCCHMKAIMCLLDAGHASKVVAYIRKIPASSSVTYVNGATGDKVAQVEGLPSMTVIVEHVINSQPGSIVSFVNELLVGLKPGEPLCDVSQITELLIKHEKLQETTKILLEYLKPNKPQHAQLQTRLLEVTLQRQPKVAEMILQLNAMTHFDRTYIARLCEDAGMFELAMQHYDSFQDVRRIVMKGGSNISTSVIEKTLKGMDPDQSLEVLREMLDSTEIANESVISCALSLHKHIGTMKVVEMFERTASSDLLFSFLRALPVMSQGSHAEKNELNAELVYKFIQCCIDRQESDELERICKDSNCYDGARVKDLLKQAALPNPKSLLIVCHKLGALSELTEYLYRNNMERAIELYVNTINPGGAPTVVSTLFDLGASETVVNSILENLHDTNAIKSMIKVADERHQLMVLREWLETRVAKGYKEPEVHTALAKILVSSQKNAEEFLRMNKLYDHVAVGKFCEDRDPMLAFLIYSEALLDSDVVRLCMANSMHKMLASYALKRSSPMLWNGIMSETSTTVNEEGRKRLCEELVAMAPECPNASEISCVLKALLDNNRNAEVIALLEQILLNPTQFSSSSNLQNLLLATAVKTDPSRLDEYLLKLNNYDVAALSKLANSLGLARSSFAILKSGGKHSMALDALLSIKEPGILEEAHAYVEDLDKPELWFKLGRAYLADKQMPKAIDAYLCSKDLSDHGAIKRACEDDKETFLKWLKEGRKVRETREIDTDLLLCLADQGKTDEFQSVLAGKHAADVILVGSKLMDSGKFKEAVMIYSTVPNYAKLAVCYVNLGDFELAAEAALKSRNPQVLRQVVEACIGMKQMNMANKVALDLLTFADFLPGIVTLYETSGHVDDLIMLLESANRSIAVSTELAIAIAKYKPERLMEYFTERFKDCDLPSSMNITRVARECANLWLWKEAVYLYNLDSPDRAIMAMVSHYGLAWDEELFFSIASKVVNPEALYKAIHFCIQCKPLLLPRLLAAAKGRIDAARAVKILKNANCLGFARKYLEEEVDRNSQAANDTLFEIYVEEEETELLESCLAKVTTFDQAGLCAMLEKHRLRDMRSIAARLYNRSRQFAKAAEIYRVNEDFVEAMSAVNLSRSESMALGMLRQFAERGLHEEFVACLAVNFSILESADVLELAWIYHIDVNMLMPFIIQTFKNMPRGVSRQGSSQRTSQTMSISYR